MSQDLEDTLPTFTEDAAKQPKTWFITDNHIPQDPNFDASQYLSQFPLTRIKYAIWQMEKGGKEGRYHVHVLLTFNNGIRFNTMKKHFPTAHFSRSAFTKKDLQKIAAYCSKEETRVAGPWKIHEENLPEHTTQGKRTDLQAFSKRIITAPARNEHILDIAQEQPEMFLKYGKAAFDLYGMGQAILRRTNLPTHKEIPVHVYYGKARTGKTYMATHTVPQPYMPLQSIDKKNYWFDGYMNEETLFIDEYDGALPISVFNTLTTEQARFNSKGRSITAIWTKVIIASNIHPSQWYNREDFGSEDQYSGFCRRITKILYFEKRGEPPQEKPLLYDFENDKPVLPL